MAKPPTLTAKHWKALELIEEGTLNHGEIAKACGFSVQMLTALRVGNVRLAGSIAGLFYEEIEKINDRNTKKFKELTKEAKRDLVTLMRERIDELKKIKKPTSEVSRELALLLNTLSKSTPGIEIGHFTYAQGMTAEELANEFRKLNAVAQDALVRGRVSRARPGSPGEILGPSQRRDQIPEEPEAALLPSGAEAGEIPHLPMPD